MHHDPRGRQRRTNPTLGVDLETGPCERCRGGFGGRIVLTISSGHSVDYFLNAVATGRENYYTGAVAAGEPPGRWSGRGEAGLGTVRLGDSQRGHAHVAAVV